MKKQIVILIMIIASSYAQFTQTDDWYHTFANTTPYDAHVSVHYDNSPSEEFDIGRGQVASRYVDEESRVIKLSAAVKDGGRTKNPNAREPQQYQFTASNKNWTLKVQPGTLKLNGKDIEYTYSW
jgi:hypothetical protein